MSGRPAIGLGDLILSLGLLRPDSESAAKIARWLGLQGGSLSHEPTVEPPDDPHTPPSRRTETGGHSEQSGSFAAEDASGTTVDVELLQAPAARPAPSWLRDVLPPPARTSFVAPPPDLEPLFRPSVASGILGVALCTWQSDGPLDTDLIVDRIARLQPLRALPHRLQPTLREGAQILVDVSEGMAPFTRDAQHLVAAIKRIAGDSVRVASFDTDPRRAGRGSRRRWGPWELVQGVPVIAVSDVGIAAREPSADPTTAWLEIAERARRAETSITAFVPWSADRWPGRVAQTIRLIEWDRGTTISSARRARQAHASVR